MTENVPKKLSMEHRSSEIWCHIKFSNEHKIQSDLYPCHLTRLPFGFDFAVSQCSSNGVSNFDLRFVYFYTFVAVFWSSWNSLRWLWDASVAFFSGTFSINLAIICQSLKAYFQMKSIWVSQNWYHTLAHNTTIRI